jgi:phage portal protein BeeE
VGVISELASGKANPVAAQAVERGRDLWRQAFSLGTDKESGGRERFTQREPISRPVIPGGSKVRGLLSEPQSVKRLLEALRSMAPGGWSDDRYEQTARNYLGIAYIAIHRIATQWQQAEFKLYRKTRKDEKTPEGRVLVTEDDPPEGDRVVKPYDLVRLLERPNRQDYFGKLLYRYAQQKYLTGTALTYMVPNRFGTPMELYCIPTAVAIPQPAVNPDYPDGFYRIQPLYPYGPFSSYPTPATAVGAPIPAQWMLRFQFPHPLLRYEGYSPLTGLSLEMDEFKMIGRSRHYKMRRTMNPSVVLDTSDAEGAQQLPEPELERLKAEIEGIFFGPENAGGLLVPPPGCKLSDYGSTPKEMDYPQSWSQMVDFLLAGFGITKPAAGMLENASYSTLFATLKQLYWLTLEPDLRDIAQELTHHLAPFFGDDLILEISGRPINDHDVNMAKANIMAQNRAGTINQLLMLLDLPTSSEEWGNERLGTDPNAEAMAAMGGAPGAGAPQGAEASPEVAGAQPPQPPTTIPEQMPNEVPEVDGPLGPLGPARGTKPVGERKEPPESAHGRPKPQRMGLGSLGPRKALPESVRRRLETLPEVGIVAVGEVQTKSLYERMLEICDNGNGNGKH